MIVGVGRKGELLGVPEGAAEPDVRVAVSEALDVLRARYRAGEPGAVVEAIILVGQAAALPLGGGYRHAWPPLPADWDRDDTEAAIVLHRARHGAEDAADILRRAASAQDISSGLRLLLASVLDAERGAGLLREARDV